MEAVTDFLWGALKSLQTMTTAMKLKDICSFRRKAMTNIDSILKNRDISLLAKVHVVKAVVSPVVRYVANISQFVTFHFHIL